MALMVTRTACPARVPEVTACGHDFRHLCSQDVLGTMALMQTDRWLRAAGVATWLVCGIPVAAEFSAVTVPTARAVWAAAGFLVFGAAFWINTSAAFRHARRSIRAVLLLLQVAGGLSVVASTGHGLPGAILVIIAGQLPGVFSASAALRWIALQSIVLVVILAYTDGRIAAVSEGAAFAGFQIFAVATAWLAHSERTAREDLARTNAALTATRELLAENSRVAERLRIARDLHDALGHHLTALSIQLDVASRLTGGPAANHIREAHAIAKLLLSDVRDAVSRLRGSSRIDLSQALNALTGAPAPMTIHLDVPARLDLEDAAQAHALLRCVQEIITNTSRHASAQNLWITIVQRPDGIDLRARDDGCGSAEVRWGNGLRGIRERFEEYAGRIDVKSVAGEGFEVHGFMPRPEVA
jgi:signal transduction histidine kinase